MTEKEIKRNLVAWSSGIKILLGPLDAQDQNLGNKVRDILRGIDTTWDRIDKEGIKAP